MKPDWMVDKLITEVGDDGKGIKQTSFLIQAIKKPLCCDEGAKWMQLEGVTKGEPFDPSAGASSGSARAGIPGGMRHTKPGVEVAGRVGVLVASTSRSSARLANSMHRCTAVSVSSVSSE